MLFKKGYAKTALLGAGNDEAAKGYNGKSPPMENMTVADVMAVQTVLGVEIDGKWGKKSQEALDEMLEQIRGMPERNENMILKAAGSGQFGDVSQEDPNNEKLQAEKTFCAIFKTMGWTMSDKLFYHALYGEGQPLDDETKAKLSKALSMNKSLATAVIEALKEAPAYRMTVAGSCAIGWKDDRDLYLALHKVNFQVKSIKKRGDGQYDIKVVITDVYDFHEMAGGTPKGLNKTIQGFNNAAYELQERGILTPFKIEVETTIVVPEL